MITTQISEKFNWSKNRHTSQNPTQSMQTPREHKHDTPKLIVILIQLIIDFILTLLFGIASLLFEFGMLLKPRSVGFIRDDPNISKPYFEKETVPTWLLLVIFLPSSLIVIFIGETCFKASKWVKSWYKALLIYLHITLVFLFGLVSTNFVTVLGKIFVGALRPDFLSRCIPNYELISPSQKFITENICTGVASVIEEGRKSFPSGHSSISWYCAVFIVLYLEKRFPDLELVFLKPLLQLLPISIAIFVTATRLTDYRHHFLDVSVGAILGTLIAIWTIYILLHKKSKKKIPAPENDLEHATDYHQAKVI